MASRADSIASVVIEQFNRLPAKRKPSIRDNGLREWVPLSGIVAEIDAKFICLALATGMKCLPASKLEISKGVAIHDWHAEVLAIRAFNRFVLDECQNMARGVDSRILRRREALRTGHDRSAAPFEVQDGVKLHMYCSEAPCGDASMELIMAEQEDSSPWPIPSSRNVTEPDPSVETDQTSLPGRAYFSQLGVVRRKPARSDAEPTLSKSCSDKLALKQCTSLLGALTSLFVEVGGAFIDTLVVPRSRYSEVGCERAFSARGRMAPMVGARWHEGYAFRPFSMETTEMEFEYSRRMALERSSRVAGSNLAAVWTRSGLEETVLGGVIRGRKPFDIRGASGVSRLQMWKTAKGLAESFDDPGHLCEHFGYSSYKGVKKGPALAARCQVKADARATALIGWIVDDRDSDFGIISS